MILRPNALSCARKYSFLTAEGRAHVARLVREGKTPRQAIDETLMLALTPSDAQPARQDRCA